MSIQTNLSNFIIQSKMKGQVGLVTNQNKNVCNKYSHHFEELRFRKAGAFVPVHTARRWKREHRNQLFKAGQETISLNAGTFLTFLDGVRRYLWSWVGGFLRSLLFHSQF